MASKEARKAAIAKAAAMVRNPNASPFVRRATASDKAKPNG